MRGGKLFGEREKEITDRDILSLHRSAKAKDQKHRRKMRTRARRIYPETGARLRTENGSAGRLFVFHDKLCGILDSPPTPNVDKTALRVFDEFYAQLIDNRKQPQDEIIREMRGDDLSQPSDSGP